MSLPFDAVLKDILCLEPGDLPPVFRLPATQPARTLNVDLSTISAATDVAFGFGEPLQEIVDINFQSGPDANVDARMLLYSAAYRLRFRVPVRSILVLLRPKANVAGLDGKLAYSSGNNRVEFDYDVIRLWEQPAELFLNSGFGMLPLAPLCKMPDDAPLEDAIRSVVRAIDLRLATLGDHAVAVRLMTATFILTGLRMPKESLRPIFDGVRIMHETTAFDQWLEEREIRTNHKTLFRLGRRRFGAPDAVTEAAVTSIEDLDRLERLVDAMLTASSWKELLDTP